MLRSFATSLLAVGVFAQHNFTPMDNAAYPEFDSAISMMDDRLTWEAFEVTSRNGYVKTLFHITGTKDWDDYAPWRQPILVVNGNLTDVTSYLYDPAIEFWGS